MFLRAADILIDLLIHALLTLDRVNQSLRVCSLNGLSHLTKSEAKLEEMDISGYLFWIGKESKKLDWRTLTGPKKLNVFANIDLVDLFPELENVTDIQKLWKNFFEIHRIFSIKPSEITEETMSQFQSQLKNCQWLFKNLSGETCNTIHTLHDAPCWGIYGFTWITRRMHLARFRETYNIDLMTKDFFHSSHHGMQCFIQILQKQNRLEYLESMGEKQFKNKLTWL